MFLDQSSEGLGGTAVKECPNSELAFSNHECYFKF